jgi:ribosome biogenesis GTPase
MSISQLESYGYNSYFKEEFLKYIESQNHLPNQVLLHKHQGLIPARITSVNRGIFSVACEEGTATAEVSGRFRITAVDPSQYPVIGDWVVIRYGGEDGVSLIEHILPRLTVMFRRQAGSDHDLQYMAANLDIVFIVQGLDRGYSTTSLERYLAAAREGNITPVLILNKTDTLEDAESAKKEITESIKKVYPELPVIFNSMEDLISINRFGEFLRPGITAAFLGPSGVGKSTLVNALTGKDRQETGEVRMADKRGKHTTTVRDMILMPDDQGILIDTPGMREFGVYLSMETISDVFADISILAEKCRFTDCRHENEPGCAVRGAIENGELPEKRLISYRKFLNETMTAAEKRAKWKGIHSDYRKLKQFQEKNSL